MFILVVSGFTLYWNIHSILVVRFARTLPTS